MELCQHADGLRRSPRPGGPVVTVLFGGDPEGPDVGVVRVEVPPGGGMAEHTHGGSDVVLVPVVGMVVISKGAESITVRTGDAALVRKEEAVSLANPGEEVAQVLVAAGPPSFVSGIRDWPEPSASH